ncbi:unnamed protein product [Cyclocybe aegerita]|uniref:BTB domain-containing protein n=1 Tax=Cyclocybe aegerita TaxID=1973307 RepID=A0A8S0W127_CYCAE|nr:unnamed protein product [Cyclocybe aegerita]
MLQPSSGDTFQIVSGSSVKRHEVLWLEDGNVILQAEDVQFRVHRSMLVRHSPIFRDMFSIPQPQNPQDSDPDGCPVIVLSDSADDVGQVLAIFYDNYRFLDLREKLSIGAIAAMLRMGKKYDIAYLRDDALKRLRHDFPITLPDWEASYNGSSPIDYTTLSDYAKTVAAIISLGREHDIQSILPGAFLHYTNRATLEEILAEDNNNLPQEACTQCVIGRDKFLRRVHSTLLSWFRLPTFMPISTCSNIAVCPLKKQALFRGLCDSLWMGEGGKVRWDFTDCIPGRAAKTIKILCPSCATSISRCYRDSRNKLWEELPSFFGLLGWDQLRDFDQ